MLDNSAAVFKYYVAKFINKTRNCQDMKIWVHSVASLILAALIYPLFNWKALLVLIGGVLIDVDHYFRYVYKYRDFSIIKCHRYYELMYQKNNFNECNDGLFVFHTIEFLLLIGVLSYFSTAVLVFAIGLLGHYLLDVIWHITIPKRIIANHSLTSWILKNKQKV